MKTPAGEIEVVDIIIDSQWQETYGKIRYNVYVFCTAMEAAKFSYLQDKLYDLYLEHHGIDGVRLIDEVTKIINKNKNGEDKSSDSQDY